jgi:hypothetical protein
MSTLQIVILIAICGAFTLFAVVLAWGEQQTRNVRHSRGGTPRTDAKLQLLKNQAGAAAARARSSDVAPTPTN